MVEGPIRGAEPCPAQKSGLGPEGVRSHNASTMGVDLGPIGDNPRTLKTRTLRSDNGVQRVTLRFNSSQALVSLTDLQANFFCFGPKKATSCCFSDAESSHPTSSYINF